MRQFPAILLTKVSLLNYNGRFKCYSHLIRQVANLIVPIKIHLIKPVNKAILCVSLKELLNN